MTYHGGNLALAHNGNLTNYKTLHKQYVDTGLNFDLCAAFHVFELLVYLNRV